MISFIRKSLEKSITSQNFWQLLSISGSFEQNKKNNRNPSIPGYPTKSITFWDSSNFWQLLAIPDSCWQFRAGFEKSIEIHLYQEIPQNRPRLQISGKNEHSKQIMYIYVILLKIYDIHSRQEKSIRSLLVELEMICDFATVWWLLWGSGRAARHDNIIWTVTVSLYCTLFP